MIDTKAARTDCAQRRLSRRVSGRVVAVPDRLLRLPDRAGRRPVRADRRPVVYRRAGPDPGRAVTGARTPAWARRDVRRVEQGLHRGRPAPNRPGPTTTPAPARAAGPGCGRQCLA